MNAEQFIGELRKHLSHLPASEVEDIIRDQREFISDAVSAGRSEESVVAGLGDPRAFAASLSVETKLQQAAQHQQSIPQQAGNVFGAVLAILALAPLNLIFVLGPFLALSGIIFGGWAASVAGSMAVLVMMGVFFFKLIFISAGLWTHLSTFFFILGSVGASFLALLFMAFVTRWFFVGTIGYLKWNLKFIKGRA